MERKIVSRISLEYFYCKRLFSSRMIGKIYHCDQGVILRNLRKYNIPIRNPCTKVQLLMSELQKLYLFNKLSTYKIAKIYQCDSKTIYKNLKKFKIPIRPPKKYSIKKELLKNLYFRKKLSLATIGKLLGTTPVTILNKMKKYGFVRRKSWETLEKYPKYNFNGSLLNKAYLLGFRAGDLEVRRTSKITKNIQIGCNSTKKAQINLIKNLFKQYGPVWIGQPNKKGVQSIDALVNASFSFLIPKHDKINQWILRSRKYFMSYLAGYTDAEGSIKIYDNRAKFRLGSYDIGILTNIQKIFNKLTIESSLKLEMKAGFTDKRGITHRGNFWRITINKKKSLISLLISIKPFLKHSDRIEDINKAIINIKERNKKFNFNKENG